MLLIYSRRDVERLIGCVWDGDYLVWGVRNELAADPDLPKGTVDPSHGNSIQAMVIDIKMAYARTALTTEERAVLHLMGRFELTTREAAAKLGYPSKTSVATLWESAIGKMTCNLNGDDYEYDDDPILGA